MLKKTKAGSGKDNDVKKLETQKEEIKKLSEKIESEIGSSSEVQVEYQQHEFDPSKGENLKQDVETNKDDLKKKLARSMSDEEAKLTLNRLMQQVKDLVNEGVAATKQGREECTVMQRAVIKEKTKCDEENITRGVIYEENVKTIKEETLKKEDVFSKIISQFSVVPTTLKAYAEKLTKLEETSRDEYISTRKDKINEFQVFSDKYAEFQLKFKSAEEIIVGLSKLFEENVQILKDKDDFIKIQNKMIKDFEDELAKLKVEAQKLEDLVRLKGEQIKFYEKRVANYDDEVLKLAKDIKDKEAQILQKDNLISLAKTNIEERKEEIKKLEIENQDLKAVLDDSLKKNNSLVAKIEELDKYIEKLKKDYVAKEKELGDKINLLEEDCVLMEKQANDNIKQMHESFVKEKEEIVDVNDQRIEKLKKIMANMKAEHKFTVDNLKKSLIDEFTSKIQDVTTEVTSKVDEDLVNHKENMRKIEEETDEVDKLKVQYTTRKTRITGNSVKVEDNNPVKIDLASIRRSKSIVPNAQIYQFNAHRNSLEGFVNLENQAPPKNGSNQQNNLDKKESRQKKEKDKVKRMGQK